MLKPRAKHLANRKSNGYNLTMSKIETGLQQNLTQSLKLTPQMLQSMKVLQMNNLELSVYVSQLQEGNPFLEADLPAEDLLPDENDVIAGEICDEDDFSGKSEKRDLQEFATAAETIQDHLMGQLAGIDLSPEEYRNCEFLIYSVDDRGYMVTSVEEAAEDLGVTADSVEKALKIVQSFDPAGAGARDLKECLRLQARSMGVLSDDMRKVIDLGLDAMKNGSIQDAVKAAGVRRSSLEKCLRLLREMEPIPGRSFSSCTPVQYVIPDVEVICIEGSCGGGARSDLEVRLRSGSIPSVRISELYDEVKDRVAESPELREYVTRNMNEARDLIACIHRRETTLLRIIRFLATYQKNFFRDPEGHLRPLTMEQTAEELDLSPSTVSRAVSGKYLQCGRGVFPLRQFFSEGFSGKKDASAGAGGKTAEDEISAVSVRAMIRKLIEQEDPHHPLSDEKIRQRLMETGVDISRRTVAKYRGMLGIGGASERRVR